MPIQPFETFTGRVAPLDRAGVDTDVIIPKQFLKSITRRGLGPFAFDNWRYQDEGELGQDCSRRPRKRDFVLNKPRYANASILLARENFGCGSSREHAVWALMDYGFRVVIASSIAEIFFSNAVKNGLLPVTLSENVVEQLFRFAHEAQEPELEVDLEHQVITPAGSEPVAFEFDGELKRRLIRGLDDIALILNDEEAILAYEKARIRDRPWLFNDLAEKVR